MAKAKAKAKSKKPKLTTQEILEKYDEPTLFKVKLLGDRYYEHYLHRAGKTITMLIDPKLKAPNQIRILSEADPEDVDGEEEVEEEESTDESKSRGETEEEKI